MSIVNVTKKWSISDSQREGDADNIPVYSATSGWQVEVSTAADDEMVALKAPGLPAHLEAHPSDSRLLCQRLDARRESDAPRFFVVTASWGEADTKKPKDPLQDPPIVDWSYEADMVPVDRDADGKAIVNTAGESPDPPLTKPVHDPVLHTEFNVRNFSSLAGREYIGKVCNHSLLGYETHEPKMKNLTAKYIEEMRNRVLKKYWHISMDIQFRKGGWWTRMLNAGYRQLVTASDGTKKLEIIKDRHDNAVNAPYPLDVKGAAVPEDKLHQMGSANPKRGKTSSGTRYEQHGVYVWLLYRLFEDTSFAALQISQKLR